MSVEPYIKTSTPAQKAQALTKITPKLTSLAFSKKLTTLADWHTVASIQQQQQQLITEPIPTKENFNPNQTQGVSRRKIASPETSFSKKSRNRDHSSESNKSGGFSSDSSKYSFGFLLGKQQETGSNLPHQVSGQQSAGTKETAAEMYLKTVEIDLAKYAAMAALAAQKRNASMIPAENLINDAVTLFSRVPEEGLSRRTLSKSVEGHQNIPVLTKMADGLLPPPVLVEEKTQHLPTSHTLSFSSKAESPAQENQTSSRSREPSNTGNLSRRSQKKEATTAFKVTMPATSAITSIPTQAVNSSSRVHLPTPADLLNYVNGLPMAPPPVVDLKESVQRLYGDYVAKEARMRQKVEQTQQEERKVCTFAPKLMAGASPDCEVLYQQNQNRRFDDFVADQMNYKRAIEEKVAIMREAKMQVSVDNMPFKPEINAKSRKMGPNRDLIDTQPVHDRLYRLAGRRDDSVGHVQGEMSTTPTSQYGERVKLFKPEITETGKQVVREGRIADLLYQDALRRQDKAARNEAASKMTPSLMSSVISGEGISKKTCKAAAAKFVKEYENCWAIQVMSADESSRLLAFDKFSNLMTSMGYLTRRGQGEALLTHEKILLFVFWKMINGDKESGKVHFKNNLLSALLGLANYGMELPSTGRPAQVATPAPEDEQNEEEISSDEVEILLGNDHVLAIEILNQFSLKFHGDGTLQAGLENQKLLRRVFESLHFNRMSSNQQSQNQQSHSRDHSATAGSLPKMSSGMKDTNGSVSGHHLSNNSAALALKYREKILNEAREVFRNAGWDTEPLDVDC